MKLVKLRLIPRGECIQCYYYKYIDHVRQKNKCPRREDSRLKCTRTRDGKFRLAIWQVKT